MRGSEAGEENPWFERLNEDTSMLNHRINVDRVGLTIVCVCLLLVAAQKPEKEPIPSDFKLVARYYPGYSSWKPWRCTITADGKVTQEVFGMKTDSKMESRLAAEDVRSLAARVNEAQFFNLKKRYEPKIKVTDNPTLELMVTWQNKTHEVDVYAPNFEEMPQDKEVKRFFRVWSEVLRKVPSPNPKQKPELYKP
jgi:hypothetical protein